METCGFTFGEFFGSAAIILGFGFIAYKYYTRDDDK